MASFRELPDFADDRPFRPFELRFAFAIAVLSLVVSVMEPARVGARVFCAAAA
jgi:hypothetical protein